jgi:hypothetical protein
MFASSAGASFGALVVGVRWFARRMPRTLVIVSDVFLAFLAAAWVAYALLSIVNLTLFEVVAFTLVFVWLITLVVTTHRTGESAPATAATPGADAAPMGAVAPEAGASAASTWGWARGPTRGPAVVRTALPKRPFALSARLAGIPELGPRFSSIRS